MNPTTYLRHCDVLCKILFNVHKRKLNPPQTLFQRPLANASGSSHAEGSLTLTVDDMLRKWSTEFLKRSVAEPKESVEYIIAHVLGSKKITDVYRRKSTVLLPADVQRIDNLCTQRLQKMPVQYIIQEWDFRDLTLKMSRPVFIPRPETEMLVDIVLNAIDSQRVDKVLELCCGSGAVSLALLKSRRQLRVTAIDRSEHACKLTEENAIRNNLSSRLKTIQAEINAECQLQTTLEHFDIIVSNPPYIPSKDMEHLQPEIKLYEDPAALDGGYDGLTVIKLILNVCSRLLNYGGKLFLEVDPTHPALLKSWLEENRSLGLMFLRSHKDFCGKERFVEIERMQ